MSMTVTISRLYDSYAQATEAVRNLEKAGVPQGDISIVSNNSDNWYSEDTARRPTDRPGTIVRDHKGVDRLLPRDGLPHWRSVPQSAARPVALLVP
jgi:hypothetical protein